MVYKHGKNTVRLLGQKLVKPRRNPVNSMFSEERSKIYNYFTTFESHDMILAGVAFTPVFFVVTFLQNK